MYSCTMPVPDQGGLGAHAPKPHEEDVSVLKNLLANNGLYGNGLVEFGVFGVVWGGLGCFNGPHYGYANRSNSQTSLPRAIGSPTSFRNSFASRCRLIHDIWYPARCSAARKE